MSNVKGRKLCIAFNSDRTTTTVHDEKLRLQLSIFTEDLVQKVDGKGKENKS